MKIYKNKLEHVERPNGQIHELVEQINHHLNTTKNKNKERKKQKKYKTIINFLSEKTIKLFPK